MMSSLRSFLLACALTGVLCEPAVLNLDYQIHSNNDLREFRQVLVKGSRKFKFDPHYVSHHSKCGKSKECFLLNHDLPTTVFSDYNTSTELLNYLASSEFKVLTNNEYVSIALCFKSAPDKCKEDSDSFQGWLKLVNDFYDQALATVPSNVEFILDGDAKPMNCMVGMWQPWKSVWIRTDASASSCFSSNTTDNDCHRFQVLNNPENVSNWEWMAQTDVDYGKFHDSSYPYQLWEPDQQEDMLVYRDLYLGGPQHAPGYHFAINSDIAMFRVYISGSGEEGAVDVSGQGTQGINQPLANGSFPVGERPLVVSVSDTSFAAVYTSAEDHSTLHYVTIAADTDKGAITTSEPVQLSKDVSSALAVSESNPLAGAVYSADRLVLIARQGGLAAVSLTDSSSFATGTLSAAVKGSVHSAVALTTSQCPQAASTGSACVQVTSVEGGSVYLTTLLLSFSGSAVAVSVLSTLTVALPDSETAVQVKSVVVSQSDASDVLLFMSNADLKVKALWLAGSTAHSWTQVTVGQSIDVAYSAASDALLLVNDFGYCYNSHDHNTRSYPTVCAAEPTPTQHTLDYSLGLLPHWKALLSSASASSASPASAVDAPRKTEYAVNSCHDYILHGSYDMGSRPVAAFLPLTSSSAATDSANTFFLALHEGLPADSVSIALGGCGEALSREGVVVDHFRITEWVAALQQL